MITHEVCSLPTWLLALENANQSVQNRKLNLELYAIDAWLQGSLQVKEIGALDTEERDVESNDENIDIDKVAQNGKPLA